MPGPWGPERGAAHPPGTCFHRCAPPGPPFSKPESPQGPQSCSLWWGPPTVKAFASSFCGLSPHPHSVGHLLQEAAEA